MKQQVNSIVEVIDALCEVMMLEVESPYSDVWKRCQILIDEAIGTLGDAVSVTVVERV